MERVYTIPLGEALRAAPKKRAKRVVSLIREFALKHMKVEMIKIASHLNEKIWEHGARNPPREIKVQMVGDVEDKGEKKINVAWVELADVKFDLAAIKEKRKAREKKKEEGKKAKEEAAKKEEEEAKAGEVKEKKEEKEKEQKEKPAKKEAKEKKPGKKKSKVI